MDGYGDQSINVRSINITGHGDASFGHLPLNPIGDGIPTDIFYDTISNRLYSNIKCPSCIASVQSQRGLQCHYKRNPCCKPVTGYEKSKKANTYTNNSMYQKHKKGQPLTPNEKRTICNVFESFKDEFRGEPSKYYLMKTSKFTGYGYVTVFKTINERKRNKNIINTNAVSSRTKFGMYSKLSTNKKFLVRLKVHQYLLELRKQDPKSSEALPYPTVNSLFMYIKKTKRFPRN